MQFTTFLLKPVAYPGFGIHALGVSKEVRMTTTLQSLRFGVEIECVGCSKERLTRAINIALPGSRIDSYRENSVIDVMGRSWNVVRDGSLSGSENGEIVTPPLNYSDIEALQNVIRSVRHAGARVDASCGIHIHVDGSQFAAKSLTNLVKLVYKQERIIEHALQVSETRLNRYCRSIDAGFMTRLEARAPRDIREFSAAWYGRNEVAPSRYDSTRYHGLNLNSFLFRGTVEFRYFNGTLHAGKVKAYIQFCLAVVAKALNARSASSKRREFRAETAKYDFRVWLIELGLNGPEFKTARHHLCGELAGNAARRGTGRYPGREGGENDGGSEGPIDNDGDINGSEGSNASPA